ncbi:UDP-glycosyltransferase UGT5 [Pseudolycoriella hygida]|uniref:UDP-glycosyltransferase UGT5 n=1 Tax=Pseudolycoriella hygida TaxID=35572 RepID=A0A9Q0N540_9DIPT|nr:UDP-glycosyltransferase UGT5 [Pseudolycoriella hygida]
MNINLILVLCLQLLSSVRSYKILFLVPFNAKSHWLFLENFVQVLLDRHHEVTCVTSISLTGTHPANYTEILIEPALDFETIVSQEELYKISGEFSISILLKMAGIRKFAAEYAFDSLQVQRFLQRQDLHFDLVINEEFFQESFLMFAHKYKTPLVTISK